MVMNATLRQILFLMVGIASVTLTLAVLVAAFGRESVAVDNSPRAVFEAHLAALDAGEWELSDIYAKDECTINAQGGSGEALQKVIDSGFSYRRSFQIEDVWINEDGTEAILELNVPSELPSVVVLDLVGEGWLIAC